MKWFARMQSDISARLLDSISDVKHLLHIQRTETVSITGATHGSKDYGFVCGYSE